MLQLNVDNIESITVKAITKMKYHEAGNPKKNVEEIWSKKLSRLSEENYKLWPCLCTTIVTILYFYVNRFLV